MEKVVIVDTGYESYKFEHELFGSNGFRLELYSGAPNNAMAKAEFAKDAVGILVRGTEVSTQFLDKTPKIRALVRYGIGYDNIDIHEATKRGIKVANVRGYARHSVSDHALAMIYSLARMLPVGQQQIRTHFSKPPVLDIFELHDKTLGIIGLGRIGSHLAHKARGIFRKVLAYDPYISDETFTNNGVNKTDLSSLLAQSHVISLNCNLTDETRHILNKKAFQQMKNRPIIINTARGPVLDQVELLDALNSNKIHSAGIDVFETEPPTAAQDELLKHPRAICTGHYAWYSDTASKELQQRAAQNLLKLLQGELIDDCLNP